MAVYGSLEGVKRFLQAVDGDDFSGDQETRIDETRAAVSSLIEDRTGIVYQGLAAVPETIRVRATALTGELWLPKPIVSVTSVAQITGWTGSAWTTSTVGAVAYYLDRLDPITGTARTLSVGPGYIWYSGDYLVTGVWADALLASDVPDDINYVVNYVTAETYKKQNASPAGFAGPDGSVVVFRDALKEPDIQALIAKHTRQHSTAIVV